jgi:hypothetical protein
VSLYALMERPMLVRLARFYRRKLAEIEAEIASRR